MGGAVLMFGAVSPMGDRASWPERSGQVAVSGYVSLICFFLAGVRWPGFCMREGTAMNELLTGAVTGIPFGFLMQKAW